MASSNRHWPSLFKSKPCSTPHQWQHDINPSSLGCQKSPYTSGPGSEERSPEPKPRWNPKPEQIRILESIFNSGMVNPPRDEIRRIRAQLQEYGQVGDANVFYWFQNRKSRSKHKLRHLLSARSHHRPATSSVPPPPATSSSSSSSDRSTGSDKPPTSLLLDPSGSQANPVEPFLGYCLSATELQAIFGTAENGTVVGSGHWSELFMGNQEWLKSGGVDEAKMKSQWYYGSDPASSVASPINEAEVLGEIGGGIPARSTVFINEVAFEVGVGPLNVREAFGEEAVLLHSSGHPVVVDEFGLTVQSLQHGASYYLV